MSLTGKTPTHPARWTPAVLEAIRPHLVELGLPIHDPYAGTGVRLGELADELGLEFTGTDIETWEGADPRVEGGDSRYPLTYPPAPFVIVTSPVYFGNRISSDYVNGPTPTTKLAGRHAYGISLGRPLAPANLARSCRPAHRDEYVGGHARCARNWGRHAIVNVDGPIASIWHDILGHAGYVVDEQLEVVTPRLGGGLAGASKRASAEVVIVAVRA